MREKNVLIILVAILAFFVIFTNIGLSDEIKKHTKARVKANKSTSSEEVSLVYTADIVCKEMDTGKISLSRLPIRPPINSKDINLFNTPGNNEIIHIEDFDINNDGFMEDVYLYNPCTRYACAKIYFVIKEGDSFINEHWPKVTEEMMLSHSKLVYPCSWLTKANEIGFCEPFISFKEGKSEGKNIHYQLPIRNYKNKNSLNYYTLRYLYLEPFQFKGKTYFLASTEESGMENIYTVLKPLPDGNVKEACIFRMNLEEENN